MKHLREALAHGKHIDLQVLRISLHRRNSVTDDAEHFFAVGRDERVSVACQKI